MDNTLPVENQSDFNQAIFTPPTTTGDGVLSSQPPSLGLKPNNIGSKLKIIFVLLFLSFSVFTALKVIPRMLTIVKPSPVTITYWGLWEEEETMQPIIDQYQKEHPNITIIYKKQSPELYQERLQGSLEKDDGPDIFRFHNTWLPMFKNYLSAVPSAVFSVQDYEKTFYPVTKNDLKIGEKYYGIPLEIDGLALFYNEDLFTVASLSPPTTWEGLYETAKKLTVKDVNSRILIAGVAIGATNNIDFWSDITGLMFLQNGTDMEKIANTILQDGSNAGADTISYYVNFAKGENRVWDSTLDNSTIAFAAGRLAMYFGSARAIQEIRRLNPGLRFKIIPVPQLANQLTNWASYWVEGVNIKSTASKEAWDFLKFLSTNEILQKRYETAAKTKLFGEPPSRIDMADFVKSDPYIGVFITQAHTAKSWYLADRTPEGEKGINAQTKKHMSYAIEKVFQGTTVKEALSEADKSIQQVLVSYGLTVPISVSPSR